MDHDMSFSGADVSYSGGGDFSSSTPDNHNIMPMPPPFCESLDKSSTPAAAAVAMSVTTRALMTESHSASSYDTPTTAETTTITTASTTTGDSNNAQQDNNSSEFKRGGSGTRFESIKEEEASVPSQRLQRRETDPITTTQEEYEATTTPQREPARLQEEAVTIRDNWCNRCASFRRRRDFSSETRRRDTEKHITPLEQESFERAVREPVNDRRFRQMERSLQSNARRVEQYCLLNKSIDPYDSATDDESSRRTSSTGTGSHRTAATGAVTASNPAPTMLRPASDDQSMTSRADATTAKRSGSCCNDS